MQYLKNIIWIFLGLSLLACEPFEEDDISLPEGPSEPDFSITFLPDNPNTAVVEDLSSGNFARTWIFEGGTPESSNLAVDTVFFGLAGEYTISLHVSAEGGGGTAVSSKSVSIEEDAIIPCSDMLTMLTGGCDEGDIKCWTFTKAAGAITVGPFPGSGEWFTSTEDGLVPEQYDDSFCFAFVGNGFEYRNNGQTIDPFNGYVAIDYDPPSDYTWAIVPGAGYDGEDQIVLPEGAFMGVWDSGPLYDIVTLTENLLVVRSEIVNADGWFELYFEAL